jgi:hypothetical protein
MSFDQPMTEAQMEALTQELKKRLGLIKLFGHLGDSDDLSVAVVDHIDENGIPQKGFVRVRLQNDDVPYRVVKSGLLGAYNPDAGTPVVIGYDEKGDMSVEKMDHDGIREGGGNPLIYNPGDRRVSAFKQTDSLRPLLTGAVSASAGTTTNEIFVDRFRFSHNNTVKDFPGQTVDLSSLVPTAGNHRYVGVFLRITDLVIEIVGSTPKATITPLVEADKQECYDGRSELTIPVALWRLADAQTSVTGNDKIEDLRPWLSSLSTESGQINVDSVLFTTNPSGINEVAGLVYWNEDEYTLNVVTGLGPVLQIGQEIYILFYNDTGSQIDNLTALRPNQTTTVGGVVFPTFQLAQADTFENAEGTLVVSTMDVPINSVGLLTRFGKAVGDTTGLSAGAFFLSATTPGGLTNTRPAFPNYNISMGGVIVPNSVDGQIFVTVTRDIFDTTLNFWNGTFREAFDFLVTSNGTT